MKLDEKYRKTRKSSGFVLPFVAVMMVILVFVGFATLSLGYNARVRVLRNCQDSYATAGAEAGIVHMVSKMNDKIAEDDEWNNTTLFMLNVPSTELPNSPAKYKISVIGNPAEGFVITSTGTSGSATRTFYAMTLLRGVFDYGILVRDELKLYDNCSVSAYSSKTGQTGLGTVLATAGSKGNAKIDLKEAYVNGDVLVGPSGDPDKIINNPGVITGKVDAMKSVPEFPEVSIPGGLAYKGAIENQSKVLSGAADSGRYDKILLKANDVLEITGQVILHVAGDIEVKDAAEIRIPNDGNSSLTLYVDGKFEVTNNAMINNLAGNPRNFKLFGSAADKQDIKIDTDCASYDFYGVVYAPNAKVEVAVEGDLYGSFVCDKFELKSESAFYHDRSLAKGINDEGVYFGIGRWYEP